MLDYNKALEFRIAVLEQEVKAKNDHIRRLESDRITLQAELDIAKAITDFYDKMFDYYDAYIKTLERIPPGG